MKLKKSYLSLLFLILVVALSSCSNNENCIQIKGTSAIDIDKIYLSLMLPEEKIVVDSSEVKNGTFSFEYIPAEEIANTPHFFTIHTKNETITTIAEKGETIKIALFSAPFSTNYSIKGTEDAQLMFQLDTTLQNLDKSVKELEKIYNNDRFNDSLKVEIEKEYLKLTMQHQQYLQHFIEDNPNSMVSIPAFYQRYGRRIFFPENENKALLSVIIQNLKTKYPESEDVLFLEKRMNRGR